MLHARLAVRQSLRSVRLSPFLSVRGISYFRELLGVGPDASTEELKKAFYSKSRVYHPDLAQGDKVLKLNFRKNYRKIGEKRQIYRNKRSLRRTFKS